VVLLGSIRGISPGDRASKGARIQNNANRFRQRLSLNILNSAWEDRIEAQVQNLGRDQEGALGRYLG
jgi:hypothetical protein